MKINEWADRKQAYEGQGKSGVFDADTAPEFDDWTIDKSNTNRGVNLLERVLASTLEPIDQLIAREEGLDGEWQEDAATESDPVTNATTNPKEIDLEGLELRFEEDCLYQNEMAELANEADAAQMVKTTPAPDEAKAAELDQLQNDIHQPERIDDLASYGSHSRWHCRDNHNYGKGNGIGGNRFRAGRRIG